MMMRVCCCCFCCCNSVFYISISSTLHLSSSFVLPSFQLFITHTYSPPPLLPLSPSDLSLLGLSGLVHHLRRHSTITNGKGDEMMLPHGGGRGDPLLKPTRASRVPSFATAGAGAGAEADVDDDDDPDNDGEGGTGTPSLSAAGASALSSSAPNPAPSSVLNALGLSLPVVSLLLTRRLSLSASAWLGMGGTGRAGPEGGAGVVGASPRDVGKENSLATGQAEQQQQQQQQQRAPVGEPDRSLEGEGRVLEVEGAGRGERDDTNVGHLLLPPLLSSSPSLPSLLLARGIAADVASKASACDFDRAGAGANDDNGEGTDTAATLSLGR